MKSILCASLLILLMPSAYAASLPGDSAEGKRLLDANCMECHQTDIYTRGGVVRETAKLLNGLADEVQGKPGRKSMIADSRNPVVGTRLLREWDGIEHTVTVMKDGFDWQGRKFKSLSAVARAITGTQWNGYGRSLASLIKLMEIPVELPQ